VTLFIPKNTRKISWKKDSEKSKRVSSTKVYQFTKKEIFIAALRRSKEKAKPS
jgi:hypothetical protein